VSRPPEFGGFQERVPFCYSFKFLKEKATITLAPLFQQNNKGEVLEKRAPERSKFSHLVPRFRLSVSVLMPGPRFHFRILSQEFPDHLSK
jgi:hypothetical protein